MDYLSDVYTWFEQLDNSKKREFTHIPLLIYGLSRKATIDLRLIAADAKDDPGSKLNVCVNQILEKYREYDSIKAAQVVFSDLCSSKTAIRCGSSYSVKSSGNWLQAVFPPMKSRSSMTIRPTSSARRCSTW